MDSLNNVDWYLSFLNETWTEANRKQYDPVEPKRIRSIGHIYNNGPHARMRGNCAHRYRSGTTPAPCDVTYPYKDYEEQDIDLKEEENVSI